MPLLLTAPRRLLFSALTTWLLLAAPSVCVLPARAQTMEKVNVFRAGENGYSKFRIPGLVVTNAGTALLFCEARSGSSDWGSLDTVVKRSEDGGRTWGEMIDVSKPLQPPNAKAEESGTFNNPTAVVDRQSGAIHLLFCQSYGRLFHARSHDDGLTWTTPVEITSALDGLPADVSRKVFSPGPGHGIQLQSGPHAGRLLMSLRLSNGEGPNHTRPCWVSTLYSDDAGQTWKTGAIVTSDFAGHADVRYPMEGSVAELNGGRVMMNLRNEAPVFRRLVATSPDGISDWTVPCVDETLVEPMVFGSLLRAGTAPNGKARLLFVNPASERARPGKPDLRFRENLTVRLSDDEGASWPRSLVIEPGLSGYADIAVTNDGAILCAYERGDLREEGFGSIPRAITLARFDEGALSKGAENPD